MCQKWRKLTQKAQKACPVIIFQEKLIFFSSVETVQSESFNVGRSELINNPYLNITGRNEFQQQLELHIQAQGGCLIAGSIPVYDKLHTTFFLKGNDERLISHTQARKINQFIESTDPKTSCFVYNSAETLRKLQNWMNTFPWIKPHYAVKSNPSLPIIEDLHKNGAGFDCASKAQIQTVLKIGADKSLIVYSNPVKDEGDLMWAGQNGIGLTTADSLDQLVKIQEYAPNIGVLWRISIKQEETDKQLTAFSGKFGDDIDTPQKIHERMKEIKEMGITLKGIHFHCGSGMHGSSAFKKAVLLARECLRIGRQYGHEMKIMDVGGGFPAGDLNASTIQALSLTENDPLGYTVIAEPGRHFCSLSFYLLTRVIGKRIKNGQTCYHLNESVYHTFNCILMDSVSLQGADQFYRAIKGEKEVQIAQTSKSTIFGMTCDGIDVIARNIPIPNMKIGDWLCVSGMGAYTVGSKSTFNGMRCTETIFTWNASFEECEDLLETSSSKQSSQTSD